MLCKICHPYAVSDKSSVYIETTKGTSEIADIVVGLQFYLEENTKYGDCYDITPEIAAYMLCEFFNCKLVDKSEIEKFKEYDSDIGDVNDCYTIDLHSDREHRCGKNYKQYITKISKITHTEFVKALCSFFDDGSLFEPPMKVWTMQDILAKYEYETSLELYVAHLYCLHDFITKVIADAKNKRQSISFKLMRWSEKVPYWCIFAEYGNIEQHYCLNEHENLHHILTRLSDNNVSIIIDNGYYK